MPNRIQKMCQLLQTMTCECRRFFPCKSYSFPEVKHVWSWKYSIVLASFFSTFQQMAALHKKSSTSFMLQIVIEGTLYWTNSAKKKHTLWTRQWTVETEPLPLLQVPGSSNIWWSHSSVNECRSDDRKWPFGVQSPQFFQWHFGHVNGPIIILCKKYPSAIDEIPLLI